jgi:hypothetical protein
MKDICILCGQPIKGYGHNPEPLASHTDGRACNICNDIKVIPARIGRLREGMKKI